MIEKVMIYDGDETVFNIGTQVGTTQMEVVDYVREILPGLQVKFLPSRPVDVPCIILDNSKIMKIYGKPCTAIKKGIFSYYKYIVDGKIDR